MGQIHHRILEKIISARYNVFDQRIRLNTWEKATVSISTWTKCRWS